MIGGCLARHLTTWEDMGGETWVLHVLCNGYRIPFHSFPPLSWFPRFARLSVSSFWLGRPYTTLQCTVLRPVHNPSGIHQDHDSCLSGVTQARHSAPLSRRLASPGVVLPRGPRFDPVPATAMWPAGNLHQLQQIVPTTSSGAGLPGNQHSDFSVEGFPDEDTNRQPSLSSPSFLGFTTPDCQRVANLAWPHGVPYLFGSRDSAADAESTASPSVSVVLLCTQRLSAECLDP